MNTADLEKLSEHIRPGYVHPVLLEATRLMNRKSMDYNGRVDPDPARRDYFPFGAKSYLQMIHTKMERLRAVTKSDGPPNFESASDTLLDVINYCAFFKAWLDEEAELLANDRIYGDTDEQP